MDGIMIATSQANGAIKVKIKPKEANTVNAKDAASAEGNGPTTLTSTANSIIDEGTV